MARSSRRSSGPSPSPLSLPVGTWVGARRQTGDDTDTHLDPDEIAFSVVRPADLVAFHVRCRDLEFRKHRRDGLVLAARDDGGLLIVEFAYQHLAEQAAYEVGDDTPLANDEDPAGGPRAPGEDEVGSEPPGAPPIAARAARRSRLVFRVDAGERIPFSTEGVLEAMRRLPLAVSAAAQPKPATKISIADILGAIRLPGGGLFGHAGTGLVIGARSARRRGASEPEARGLLASGVALRALRSELARTAGVTTVTGDRSRDERATPTTSARRLADKARRVDDALSGIRGVLDEGLVTPELRLPTRRPKPGARPTEHETSIEAPYRLIISPSQLGGWAHAATPVAPDASRDSVELWHTRLGVRRVVGDDADVDERDTEQRVVRALWARDLDGEPPTEHSNEPFRMSLDGLDRVMLVRQTADARIAPPVPVDVRRLGLSSLGAWLDLHGAWDVDAYAAAREPSILSWDHVAPMGRDQYVRVVYPGFLYPFGHRAALVKITERRVEYQDTDDGPRPVAHLYQRKFIVVGERVRRYDHNQLPFVEARIEPEATPSLDDPVNASTKHVVKGQDAFFPTIDGEPFRFVIHCLDRDRRPVSLSAPLLFVGLHVAQDLDLASEYSTWGFDRVDARGQRIAFAPSAVPGDASAESQSLLLTGVRSGIVSEPRLRTAQVVLPAMRSLAPRAPAVEIAYAGTYVDSGFAGPNKTAQVWAALTSPTELSFAGDTGRSGGFVDPSMPIGGLSRALGTVGDATAALAPGGVDLDALLGGLPKLFGLFKLTDILALAGIDELPAFVSEALNAIEGLVRDVERLRDAIVQAAEDAKALAARADNEAAELRGQAEALRVKAIALQDRIVEQAAQLDTELQALMDVEAPSSPEDVAAAIGTVLDQIATVVDDAGALAVMPRMPIVVRTQLQRLVGALRPALAASDALLAAFTRLVNGLDMGEPNLRARLEWKPTLAPWPTSSPVFVPRPDGFTLSVEARSSGAQVAVDILAELRDFQLNLLPGAELVEVQFERLAFRSGSARKTEVDVVFRGIEFVGILTFVETLRNLIPLDGFSDPPYVDVSPSGAIAGFSTSLPNLAIGIFSLQNLSLAADCRIPFVGDAVTVGFSFCSRDRPFTLTVSALGGGGFFAMRVSPDGLDVLEAALEFGASLSLDFGVASGSVSVMGGVYLRLEGEAGSLAGYLRIRGEVDVLGLISASIELYMELRYDFDTGKMIGKARITVEVDVLLFSGSVEIECERRFAGANGDPPLEKVLDVHDGSSAAWTEYCRAFAPSAGA